MRPGHPVPSAAETALVVSTFPDPLEIHSRPPMAGAYLSSGPSNAVLRSVQALPGSQCPSLAALDPKFEEGHGCDGGRALLLCCLAG
jgi:hypothetical protein